MGTEFDLPKADSEKIWSGVEKSWPETVVVNKKEILPGSVIDACFVLCPLYAPGSLEESKLISPPAKIDDSRVSNKIKAYLDVSTALNRLVKGSLSSLSLNVVFANKGVLFGGEPTKNDHDLLFYHENLYKDLFIMFGSEKGIAVSFSNYDDWNVNFPRFVNPKSDILELGLVPDDLKKEESKMIWQLNKYLNLPEPVEDSKKNRHVIERVLGMQGLGHRGALWLIAGYLAFDPNISKITKENGIYLVSERLEPLFGIAKLTKSLKDLTRIQIKA